MALDEDHARMLAEAGALKGDGEKWAPPMVTYSAEVEAIYAVANDVKLLRHAFISANSEGSVPEPKLVPGPKTAFEAMEHRRRKKAHNDLAARVLPHKKRD